MPSGMGDHLIVCQIRSRLSNHERVPDLTEAFVLDGSCLRVPDGPGLGVSVDADALDELGAEVRAVAGVAR